MKLRTAIKIMRFVEEPWRSRRRPPNHVRAQIWEARRICRRKWLDRRVPYMPSDEELEERYEIMMGILTDLTLGGPMFGEGILDGLVPDEELDNARKQLGYDIGDDSSSDDTMEGSV